MIATLISCAVATLLQPSIFDSIIVLKKLPYLPDLSLTAIGMYSCTVGDFMLSDIVYISKDMSYKQIEDVLRNNKELYSIPLVDGQNTMLLLGTAQRFGIFGDFQTFRIINSFINTLANSPDTPS